MQVFVSARFAVISWLMVKAHLLLCSRWCWMEPGGVIGESSKEPANHKLIITLYYIYPNGLVYACLCYGDFDEICLNILDEGSGSGATCSQNKHCWDIDQCTDGWISSTIKTSYYLTVSWEGNPSQLWSWNEEIIWTRNGTSFQKV